MEQQIKKLYEAPDGLLDRIKVPKNQPTILGLNAFQHMFEYTDLDKVLDIAAQYPGKFGTNKWELEVGKGGLGGKGKGIKKLALYFVAEEFNPGSKKITTKNNHLHHFDKAPKPIDSSIKDAWHGKEGLTIVLSECLEESRRKTDAKVLEVIAPLVLRIAMLERKLEEMTGKSISHKPTFSYGKEESTGMCCICMGPFEAEMKDKQTGQRMIKTYKKSHVTLYPFTSPGQLVVCNDKPLRECNSSQLKLFLQKQRAVCKQCVKQSPTNAHVFNHIGWETQCMVCRADNNTKGGFLCASCSSSNIECQLDHAKYKGAYEKAWATSIKYKYHGIKDICFAEEEHVVDGQIDIVIRITDQNGRVHKYMIEVQRSKQEDPSPLMHKFISLIKEDDTFKAHLWCVNVCDAMTTTTFAQKLCIVRSWILYTLENSVTLPMYTSAWFFTDDALAKETPCKFLQTTVTNIILVAPRGDKSDWQYQPDPYCLRHTKEKPETGDINAVVQMEAQTELKDIKQAKKHPMLRLIEDSKPATSFMKFEMAKNVEKSPMEYLVCSDGCMTCRELWIKPPSSPSEEPPAKKARH